MLITHVEGAVRRRRPDELIVEEPMRVQLDVVVPSRGAGDGATPPVSTVTTLNSVSVADPVPQ